MLFKNPKLAEATLLTERPTLCWNVLVEDLLFLASVTLARFIVWRTLRRRYRDDAAHRKAFKVIRGKGSLAAQSQPLHQ
jgi:hypothetical protein